MSMSVSLIESGDSDPLSARQCVVSGTLDFNTANEALDAVAVLIKQHEMLEINLSGVSFANSAGLALLIDWLAVAHSSSHSVTFSHIPDSLHQLAEVCQVRGLI